jgi:hypothetical protein
MAKVTITIVDEGDEIQVSGEVDPPMTPDRFTFSTAEIIGLYLQSNIAAILQDAIAWARTPDPVEEPPAIQAPKLILPDDGIQGAPV